MSQKEAANSYHEAPALKQHVKAPSLDLNKNVDAKWVFGVPGVVNTT
jgi:hypothetical protein